MALPVITETVRPSALARLQQSVSVASLGGAVAWLAWHWADSPLRAVLGALVLVLGFSAVLALEFAVQPAVSRGDAAPRPSGGQVLRAWGAETAQGLRVFAWRQPWRWQAMTDRLSGDGVQGRHGVVFVHGFVCNRGFWTPWLRRVAAGGRAFMAVNLEPVFTSIDDYAPQIEAAVQRVRQVTGLPPMLVCHSMGGMAVRAWLAHRARNEGAVPGREAAAHVVTIGSPHAGTWLARWSHLPNGRQMRLASPWVLALQRAWNPGDAPPFTCWYSNCDNIVMPPSTATLPGADNRLVPGCGHVDLAFRPEVVDATLALLEGLDAPGARGSAT